MSEETIFEDSFENGLDAGLIEEGRPWNYMAMGPFLFGKDGFDVEAADGGIRVVPEKANPDTGEPMFTVTAPMQGDHMKWSVNVNQEAAEGIHGVAVPGDKVLNVEAVLGGTMYGGALQPFGDAVANPDDDIRLGTTLLMAFDPEHMCVIDFALSNERIYAIYERGISVGDDGKQPAAYSFAVPLAERTPGEDHKLRFSYDPRANEVKWYIDDELKFTAGPLGKRIDRQYMTIDNGGEEEVVTARAFNVGLGILTLLDAAADGRALVRLNPQVGYFDPRAGEPAEVDFVDDEGRDESKLFGQGAELRCKGFRIFYGD